jgi:DNA-binding MarR family transcriptional regulator
MADAPEETRLAEALVGLSHYVLQLFAEVGRANKLTQQQVELICALIVRGRLGMTELGRQLHLERSNVSNLVDRAEQRGLALRTRDPVDRRITWVELTLHGNELGMKTYYEVTKRMRDLVSKLPESEQARLAETIGRMMMGTVAS